MALVPKLVLTDLPRLASQAPNAKDLAVWVIALRRWSVQQGIQEYFQGPVPAGEPDKHAESRRYCLTSIASDSLRADLADQACANAYEVLRWVEEHWLCGRLSSEILRDHLVNMRNRQPNAMAHLLALWPSLHWPLTTSLTHLCRVRRVANFLEHAYLKAWRYTYSVLI